MATTIAPALTSVVDPSAPVTDAVKSPAEPAKPLSRAPRWTSMAGSRTPARSMSSASWADPMFGVSAA